MQRSVDCLNGSVFDVLVIGGGVTGVGVARDAALRGLRVALVEKGDFASGASSASSKLIHGGLRYLEQAALGLVTQACHERWLLSQLAPHLVWTREFMLPVYRADARGSCRLRAGLGLYDLLAGRRRIGRHRSLSAREVLALEPALNPDGLQGGFLYHDCQTDDARLCLDNMHHAVALGVVCANYIEVTGFVVRDGRTLAACATDRIGGGVLEIRARTFINATGPWAGRLPDTAVELSPTKGVHLVLPSATSGHAITFQARCDGRILFVLPWGEGTLVGTTDTPFAGDPSEAALEAGDARYLLAELRRVLPVTGAVITTFAGVRPLLRSPAAAGHRSREHRIDQHRQNHFSIAGGKLTTYRLMAEQMVDRVVQALGVALPGRTAETPLPPVRPPSDTDDITFACEQEMAVTLSDVMRRRTNWALSSRGTPAHAAVVARTMAACLGWDERQTQAQITDYEREWRRNQYSP